MHVQRICASAFRRARVLPAPSGPASLSTLSVARRAIGAGPRLGRRAALGQAAESPAIVTGCIGAPSSEPAVAPAPVRDAGSVRVGWLAWQLLPIGYLLLAAIQWTSKDPADHRVALPLSLAAVVTLAVNLFLRPGGTARADTQQPDRAHLPRRPSCESCRRNPGTVAVRFPDGVAFAVCAGCLAAGVHGGGPGVTTTRGAR